MTDAKGVASGDSKSPPTHLEKDIIFYIHTVYMEPYLFGSSMNAIYGSSDK